jgi:hypothetical protein
MGVPVVLALVLFTVNLFGTMRPPRPRARESDPKFVSSLPVHGV